MGSGWQHAPNGESRPTDASTMLWDMRRGGGNKPSNDHASRPRNVHSAQKNKTLLTGSGFGDCRWNGWGERVSVYTYTTVPLGTERSHAVRTPLTFVELVRNRTTPHNTKQEKK